MRPLAKRRVFGFVGLLIRVFRTETSPVSLPIGPMKRGLAGRVQLTCRSLGRRSRLAGSGFVGRARVGSRHPGLGTVGIEGKGEAEHTMASAFQLARPGRVVDPHRSLSLRTRLGRSAQSLRNRSIVPLGRSRGRENPIGVERREAIACTGDDEPEGVRMLHRSRSGPRAGGSRVGSRRNDREFPGAPRRRGRTRPDPHGSR